MENLSFKNFMEMPISQFALKGGWEPDPNKPTKKLPAHGYSKQDIGILKSPSGVEKIKRKWSNTKQNFNLIFLRSAQAKKHLEVGKVTPEWVKENLGIDVQPDENAITIIFTQNLGTQKVPMTAWMIAHRLGHAIKREDIFEVYFANQVMRDFREILRGVYGIYPRKQQTYGGYGYGFAPAGDDMKELLALANAVGTMKSAENRKLFSFYEFIYELVAQYITTGKITFKPLPQSFILEKRVAWGRPNHRTAHSREDEDSHAGWNEALQNYAEQYTYNLDNVFDSLIGGIFVM